MASCASPMRPCASVEIPFSTSSTSLSMGIWATSLGRLQGELHGFRLTAAVQWPVLNLERDRQCREQGADRLQLGKGRHLYRLALLLLAKLSPRQPGCFLPLATIGLGFLNLLSQPLALSPEFFAVLDGGK